MPGTNLVKSRLPLLERGSGSWAGIYTLVTPQMEVIDRYRFRARATFPDDGEGGRTYRLETRWEWDDGRTEQQYFDATLDGDILVFDNGYIAGRMWAIDDQALYLVFRFAAEPAVKVCEMIQFARDGQSRARTWHWLRDDKLYQVTLVDEWREDWEGLGGIG